MIEVFLAIQSAVEIESGSALASAVLATVDSRSGARLGDGRL